LKAASVKPKLLKRKKKVSIVDSIARNKQTRTAEVSQNMQNVEVANPEVDPDILAIQQQIEASINAPAFKPKQLKAKKKVTIIDTIQNNKQSNETAVPPINVDVNSASKTRALPYE